ncbi:aspartate dehydrogenase domain-containing protein [Corynebacterium halotolerans]|uniref:aspartate dehydrogenase domain-containing protein n=1 Tax=Corynebacterium halotolerans TaxID=225326 RepID=UPI003CFB68D5
MSTPPPTVLLLGFGAIGRQLAQLLEPEHTAGQVRLQAAVRDVDKHRERGDLGVELHAADDEATWAELVRRADIVVECAGVSAARKRGPVVIAAGRDLVLSSVGALAEPTARRQLLAGPGRLHVTAGAIGGFDLLAATAEADGLDSVRIRTRKLAGALVQPWMSEAEAAALRAADTPLTVFSGDPAAAIEKFPGNVNVAVALAWATRGRGADDEQLLAKSLQRVEVELVADPEAELSCHEITATGAAGDFRMRFESAPSPENPKTSGLTALSVAHTLRQVLKR